MLDYGGAERLASSLSLGFAAQGHSVHLVSLRDGGLPPIPKERLRQAGVALETLSKPDGFSLPALTALARYAKRNRIDVIHTHNPLVNHYGAAAARMAGVPAVVNTLHGPGTLSMPGWARTLFWTSCLITDRIVSVCDAVNEAVRKLYPLPPSKHAVIYNGIELDTLVGIRPHPANGEFVFGTMARLVPVKDHETMVEAFALVHQRLPRCRLEILGDGELRSDLERTVREKGLNQAVLFKGTSSDPAPFLAGLDAFVMSSRSEGLPLSLLEAMAAGLPVVVTAVGAMPEIVEKARCGWVCPPRQPKALADSMLAAMQAEDRLERGGRARASAVENHSAAKMTSSYLDLFEGLLPAEKRQ